VALVAHVTDVEGIWEKLEDFARDNPAVSLAGDHLVLADGAKFVFGGDAVDRGPWSRRVVASLLDAKLRYGERVVLLAGNRDINKMRLARELTGLPPKKAPRAVVEAGLPSLLEWIFEHTMGAKKAFEMRRRELAHGAARAGALPSSMGLQAASTPGARPPHEDAVASFAPGAADVPDEDVVASFIDDVQPDGPLSRYLAACQLAYRHGPTLFVHGAVTAESLGTVPGEPRRIDDLDDWIGALNAFYAEQVASFRERRLGAAGEPLWAPLVAYQAPVPGTRLHQASVVYGRPADALGNPVLPAREVTVALGRAGVGRVVVGHTPSGDSPSVLCEDGFQLVIADNSYGRVERGTQLLLDGEAMRVVGHAKLDGGDERMVRFELTDLGARGPIGLRDPVTGRLVKGKLDTGDYLAFRFLEAFQLEQTALPDSECARLVLVVPRAGQGVQ
jgi:hypothetical protein